MVNSTLPTHKYFRKEDVNVRFPKPNHTIKAKRLDMLKTGMPAVSGGFKPFRLVINLKLEDSAQPGSNTLVFRQPVEFHIRYTAADLANARATGGSLSLAFWDGTHWIRFTPQLHQFRLERWEAAKGRGLCVVNVYQWGDPPIAVGT